MTEQPTIAPPDDDGLDPATLGFVQGRGTEPTRQHAGTLRAKAAAHRAYAERLDAAADQLYRWVAHHDTVDGSR